MNGMENQVELSSEASRTQRTSDLPIFVKWMEFLKWLLPMTEQLPKKVRFTFSNRINNLALDIVEEFVEAQYSRNKAPILRAANLKLEKLRILLRLCFESRLIPQKSYRHGIYAINEVGKMLGGWLKQQEGRG